MSFTINRDAAQKGQGLVEYALLLTLIAVSSLLTLEVFGGAVQQAYCNVLINLGSREEVCPSVDDSGDEGDFELSDESEEPGSPESPTPEPEVSEEEDHNEQAPQENESPKDDDEELEDQFENRQQEPDESEEEVDEGPGVITVFQVTYNKGQKKLWFSAQYDGSTEQNVTLNASPGGYMRVTGNHYKVNFFDIECPCTITITSNVGASRTFYIYGDGKDDWNYVD